MTKHKTLFWTTSIVGGLFLIAGIIAFFLQATIYLLAISTSLNDDPAVVEAFDQIWTYQYIEILWHVPTMHLVLTGACIQMISALMYKIPYGSDRIERSFGSIAWHELLNGTKHVWNTLRPAIANGYLTWQKKTWREVEAELHNFLRPMIGMVANVCFWLSLIIGLVVYMIAVSDKLTVTFDGEEASPDKFFWAAAISFAVWTYELFWGSHATWHQDMRKQNWFGNFMFKPVKEAVVSITKIQTTVWFDNNSDIDYRFSYIRPGYYAFTKHIDPNTDETIVSIVELSKELALRLTIGDVVNIKFQHSRSNYRKAKAWLV